MIGVIEEVLDENYSHASQVSENEFVFHGSLISKVNHSCNPNTGINVNETGAHDFIARRDISVDEEITFDYAMRNFTVSFFGSKCCCGSKECRRIISGWKDLPDEKKKEYEGFVAPYLLGMDVKYSLDKI